MPTQARTNAPSSNLPRSAPSQKLPGFEYDRADFAGWWGDPINGNLGSEYGLEVCRMIRVAPFMELITDIRTIIDPALDDGDMDWVCGLRLRIVL